MAYLIYYSNVNKWLNANALVQIISVSGPNWQGMELSDFGHKDGSNERVVYLSNSSASTSKIAPQSSPLTEEGKKHLLQKPIPDVCFLM